MSLFEGRDIHPYIASFMTGGNFSEGMFEGWMKDQDTMVACCTDGIRPVVFEIKRISSNRGSGNMDEP